MYPGIWAYSEITLYQLSSIVTRKFCDDLICSTRRESPSSPRLDSRQCGPAWQIDSPLPVYR